MYFILLRVCTRSLNPILIKRNLMLSEVASVDHFPQQEGGTSVPLPLCPPLAHKKEFNPSKSQILHLLRDFDEI